MRSLFRRSLLLALTALLLGALWAASSRAASAQAASPCTSAARGCLTLRIAPNATGNALCVTVQPALPFHPPNPCLPSAGLNFSLLGSLACGSFNPSFHPPDPCMGGVTLMTSALVASIVPIGNQLCVEYPPGPPEHPPQPCVPAGGLNFALTSTLACGVFNPPGPVIMPCAGQLVLTTSTPFRTLSALGQLVLAAGLPSAMPGALTR